jgi:large subunit ribosomal protein L25
VSIVGEREPVGVSEGGILEQPLHSVTVSCLPTEMPGELRVDIGEMAIGQSLHVSDLVAPEGVTIEADPAEVMFRVSAPALVEEEVEEVPEGEEVEGEEGDEEGEPEEAEAEEAEQKPTDE